MKVVKLHEQNSEQFLNHTQNPKIAYQRPKKSKPTPKLSQNQKTQLKETKSIKACVGAFRALLFNSYLSPLQCVSLLFYFVLFVFWQFVFCPLYFGLFVFYHVFSYKAPGWSFNEQVCRLVDRSVCWWKFLTFLTQRFHEIF